MSSHRSLRFRLLSRSSRDPSSFALTAVTMECTHLSSQKQVALQLNSKWIETNRTVLALSTDALAYATEHKATTSWEHGLKGRKRTSNGFSGLWSKRARNLALVLGVIAQLRPNPARVSLAQPWWLHNTHHVIHSRGKEMETKLLEYEATPLKDKMYLQRSPIFKCNALQTYPSNAQTRNAHYSVVQRFISPIATENTCVLVQLVRWTTWYFVLFRSWLYGFRVLV